MVISDRDSIRETTVIGLGDMSVSKDPSQVLTCIGIGSCIALCIYDPLTKTGGMAHIVLPTINNGRNNMASAKYADSAVPMLLQELLKYGAIQNHMIVKIAGGAHMLSIPGMKSNLNIGDRNIDATKEALSKEKMTISGADLGGSIGRSVKLFIDTGKVFVQKIGKNSIEL